MRVFTVIITAKFWQGIKKAFRETNFEILWKGRFLKIRENTLVSNAFHHTKSINQSIDQ